ncbi:hypothetical protein ACFLS4_03075 [Bacteroidota bacterium]
MDKDKPKLPSEILDSRPELKETQIGIIKGIIGIVPHVGTMMNEILFEIPNRIYQARINELVKILVREFMDLNDKAVTNEYLESESYFDFTRLMFENCIKIKSEEKRNALAKVYLDTVVNKADFDTSKSKLFMDFVLELSPIQMNILRFIERKKDSLVEIAKYIKFHECYNMTKSSYEIDAYEFKYYCNDLESKALISLGDGLEDYESTASRLVLEDHKLASVKLTDLGKEFIKYIKNNNG